MRQLLKHRILFALVAAGVLTTGCAQPQADADRSAADTTPLADVDVLTVGGGTHHDFDRWFGEEDTIILEDADAAYTASPAHVEAALDTLDVLRITTNQPMEGTDLREAIFYFVDSGKGLVVGHAGAWYNWSDWPEYNRELVAGGTRGHRRYGTFDVDVVAPDHPVMSGVPSSFTIDDELYRFEQDPEGSAIEVLASAEDPETGDEFPIVWTVSHTNGRIVVNTLGHDGKAHEHPAYRQILQNSVAWAARAAR